MKEELLPSQVRARIVDEHQKLRRCMQATRDAADGAGQDELAASVRSLLDAALTVIEVERDLLLPTLRTIDAWGAERARRLSAWHLELRDRVDGMKSDIGRPLAERARRARAFVDELERDLGSQERLHLAQELLSELPIRTDFGGV